MTVRSSPCIALVAIVALVGIAHGEDSPELRSDEGVSIHAPEGWQRRTTKLAASTALALEKSDGGDPRPTLVVNVLPVQAMSEEKAFAQTREYLPNAGEVVERPSGKYLRVDFDYPSEGKTLKTRLYAGLREKRLFYFILTTTPENFTRDTAAIDGVVDGARFFPAVVKPDPAPEPEKKPDAAPAPEKKVEPVAPAPENKAEPVAPASEKKTESKGQLVHVQPHEDAPHLDAPKADAAVVASPVATKPRGTRRAAAANLLAPEMLVAHDGEYDRAHVAANVADGSREKGWRSPTTGRAPFRFVFELPRALDLARVSFDDATTADSLFEGAAAREVLVEGSKASAAGPWTELGRATLVAGKDDQPLELAENEVRWVRVLVLSNHGHPTLTELMEVRLHAAELVEDVAPPKPVVKTDEGPFRIERLRVSRERNGPAVEPPAFVPGDTVWIYFKPKALTLDDTGEYGLEVDLALDDAAGKECVSSPRCVTSRAKPPAPPYSPFVSLKLELPQTFPAGSYLLRLAVRDLVAKTEVREKLAFEVKKAR